MKCGMPGCPDFFDPPSRHGEETSAAAATAIRPDARTIRASALAAICAAPRGLTGSEVVAIVGRDPWVVRPRLTELKIAGEIVKTASTRKGPRGAWEYVWIRPL